MRMIAIASMLVAGGLATGCTAMGAIDGLNGLRLLDVGGRDPGPTTAQLACAKTAGETKTRCFAAYHSFKAPEKSEEHEVERDRQSATPR